MLNLQLLINRMNEKGLSYRDMSTLLGFKSSGTVHRWFTGKRQIKASFIPTLAHVLDLSIEELFNPIQDDRCDHEGGDC